MQRLRRTKQTDQVGPALLIGNLLGDINYQAVTAVVPAPFFGDGFKRLGRRAPAFF